MFELFETLGAPWGTTGVTERTPWSPESDFHRFLTIWDPIKNGFKHYGLRLIVLFFVFVSTSLVGLVPGHFFTCRESVRPRIESLRANKKTKACELSGNILITPESCVLVAKTSIWLFRGVDFIAFWDIALSCILITGCDN